MARDQTSSGDQASGYPLSFAQERLWLEYLLQPQSSAYNMPVCLRLVGQLDEDALEGALARIVERHAILRTSVVTEAGEARQVVSESAAEPLVRVHVANWPLSERWERAKCLVSEEVEKPFDLTVGPVFRACLVRINETDHLFCFVVHHIAFDGWSADVFLEEFAHFYGAAKQTNDVAPSHRLADLPLTYVDYSVWQREQARSGAFTEGLEYWRQALSGSPPRLALPTDRPLSQTRSSVGDTWVAQFAGVRMGALESLARAEGTTPYAVLLAAFISLLSRYTGQDDIVIGTPVAGRTRHELDGMLGFFVNTLPLRAGLESGTTFRELVRQLRGVVLDSLTHQDVPLEKIAEHLQVPHDFGRTPLFDTVFSFEGSGLARPNLPGLSAEVIDLFSETTIFDLIARVRATEDGVLCLWDYSSELFDQGTVKQMAGHYGRLLEHALSAPDSPLSHLPLLSQEERRRMIVDWNATSTVYPRESRVHELFEEQARLRGEEIALVSGEQTFTYAELNRRANQLARWLLRLGARRDEPVGIALERSPEMVLSALAVLKAGGGYMPLDPLYPRERIDYMLHDGDVRVVLTRDGLAARFVGEGRTIARLDTDWEEIAREEADDIGLRGSPEDLAYVIYTSGSTGRPKGVSVVHRGVVRLVKGNHFASLGPDEVFLQLAPFSFDVSTFDIWAPLLNGGRLVVGGEGFPGHTELGRLIKDHRVTTLWLTAGLFHYVVDAGLEALDGLAQLLVGGDVVSPLHARKFKARYPACRLINGYGPTENTTFTTCCEISGDELGPLPIGRPIANTTAYILDEALQPVPVGVIGELWTGGDGLARGYLNDPALTSEKFVSAPVSLAGLGSPRLYRTGDMARYRGDGVILFEGRRDNQVKVSGFRVETDEVEVALQSHPGVAQAVVLAQSVEDADKRLVALYVPGASEPPIPASLRTFLRERLPEYMVPSLFQRLSAMPLDSRGKVDRKALLELVGREEVGERAHVAPRDALELTMASIWRRLFERAVIGVHDNFFELGGHSLLAFRFFAALEKAAGVQLPLTTLFQAPTIAGLATIIRDRGWSSPASNVVQIKPGGSRLPLFLVHSVGGNILHYYDLARHLDADQPVFGIQAKGWDGKERPLIRVEDMADLYVNQITAVQPNGPYALGGGSFSGLVAFEMARRLVDRGDEVAVLALFDTFVVHRSMLAKCRNHAKALGPLPKRDMVGYVWRYACGVKERSKVRYWQLMLDDEQPFSESLTEAQRNVRGSNYLAARTYEPEKAQDGAYPGKVTLFLAGDRSTEGLEDPLAQWSRLAAGGVDAVTVPGDHVNMTTDPHAAVLARHLDECLARASRMVHAGGEAASF